MYKKMLFVLCAVLALSSVTLANDWIGGASGDWSNPANWSAGTVPGAADDVTSGQKEAFWTAAEWAAIVGNDPWTYVPATNSFPSWVHQTINTASTDVISVAAIHTSSTVPVGVDSCRMVSTILNVNTNMAVAGDFTLSDAAYTCTTVNQNTGDVTVGGTLMIPYRYRGIYNVYDGTLTANRITMVGKGDGFAFPPEYEYISLLVHADGHIPLESAAAELNIYGGVVTTNILGTRDDYPVGGQPTATNNCPMPKVNLAGGILRLTGDQTAWIATTMTYGTLYGNGVVGAIQYEYVTEGDNAGYTVVQAIPEPVTLLLLGLGGIAALRRRK